MRKFGAGHGYGKIILFGEHFVLFGQPALVCALKNRTIAKVSIKLGHEKKIKLVDLRPKHKFFSPKFAMEYNRLVKNILDFANIKDFIEVTLQGNLKVFSGGIGSSAASATAISRSVSDCFNLGWTDKEVNDAAFCGESAVHGTPSGIDNTASVYGGIFWFIKKNSNNNGLIRVSFRNPIEVVLVDSGISSDIKQVLKSVENFRLKNPDNFKDLISEYKTLVDKAKDCLERFDLKQLGFLIDWNQLLLKKIGVSCSKLNLIVKKAKDSGAFGAKLTGRGQGGLVVALTPGKLLQKKVSKKMQEFGFETLETTIG